MSLKEDIDDLKKLIINKEPDKKDKLPKPPIPRSIKLKSKKFLKKNMLLAIYLKKNRVLEFRWVQVEGGIIKIGDYEFKAYESKAIYQYKKFPVVVVFEDRLTLVGGVSEEAETRIIGGEDTQQVAKDLGVGDFAQQTIIRIIEKIEIDKELGKKKGKLPIVWIIIGVIVIVYLVSQGFLG